MVGCLVCRSSPLQASDHHIDICSDTVSRVDSVGISLNFRVEIRALHVAITIQVRASRMLRLDTRSADDSVVTMCSSSLCWCAVVWVAWSRTDAVVVIPILTLVGPDIVGFLSFDDDLFLEFAVELTVLEVRLHYVAEEPQRDWIASLACDIPRRVPVCRRSHIIQPQLL